MYLFRHAASCHRHPRAPSRSGSMARGNSVAACSALSYLPVFVPPVLPVPSFVRKRNVTAPHTALRRCRRAVRVNPVSQCVEVILAVQDDEHFIRRHAQFTGAASKMPASPEKETPPVHEDAEEQFDFVRDVDPPASPIDDQSPVKQTSESGKAVSAASQSTKIEGAASGKNEEGRGSVRVGMPPGIHSVRGRLQREGSRLLSETFAESQMRMPTRREAFLFAWELGLVVGLLLLLRAGVSRTLRWIHNRLNTTRGLQNNIPYEASVFECMQRPLEFLSLFTVGTALAEAVSRPLAATGLLRHIRTLRELGIIISAAWFLLRWIDRIRARFAVDKRIDKSQVDATSRIATVGTFIASLLISLDTIGINVQTVLAFGGIGGVAIGFAGKEIISNFFGGFMIYVTRPFAVGEWIRSIEESELNGTVEDIGWYLTRVRTWDKRPLYIPNSRFSTLIVENGSRMDNRRIVHTLHLRHEDMPVVPSIVSAMQALLMSHAELDPRQHRLAYVDSFGEYSVKIWLSCYTKSVFLYDYRRVQQDILVKCHDIIRSNGAKLANVNTRDVRPGTNTDRYGPAGIEAKVYQESGEVIMPERVPSYTHVNSDVPGSPQYQNDNPLVRFNTIESGVDFSRVNQTTVPSGVPVTASGSRDSRNGSTANVKQAGKPPDAQSSSDAASQRTTSAAAVAAAAGALAAARRNAARIEDSEKVSASLSNSRPASDDKDAPTVGSDDSNIAVLGQMRINAKPGRGAGQGTTGQTGSGGVGRINNGKSPESGATGDSSRKLAIGQRNGTGEGEISSGSVAGGSAPGSTVRPGLMKISSGRKPGSAGQSGVDGGGSAEKESSSVQGPSSGAVEGDRNVTPRNDQSTSFRNPVGEMKISSGKGGRTFPSTEGNTSSSSPATTQRKANANDGRLGSLHAKSSRADDATKGQTSQQKRPPLNSGTPVVPGTMKISKARKQTFSSKASAESDDKLGVSDASAVKSAKARGKQQMNKSPPDDDTVRESQ